MKGFRSKIEVIIVGALALLFVIWAVSKCNATKEKLQDEAAAEALEDSLANPSPTSAVTPPAGTANSGNKNQPASKTSPSTASSNQLYTRLYITIDNLKLRKEPGLNGGVITKLKLFDRVYFLDEMTDSATQVNLGYEIADEPWVKVKTMKGQTGWVYGAGVHYAKKKRSGVLE
ncbi:MAG: SH3 domain-containing protein [Saprospiraceae bacterium]